MSAARPGCGKIAMFGALFERRSATISAAKSLDPEYFTTAPVAFSKQLTVLTSISSSLPSIDPAIVITSPAKSPRSPSADGVSHTSACAAPHTDDKAAKATTPKSLLFKDIKFLPRTSLVSRLIGATSSRKAPFKFNI